MIDVNTGLLTIPGEITIKPLSEKRELYDFFKNNNAETWNVKNGWEHYYLRNFKIENKYFFFDFMFYNEILNRVDFCFYDNPVKNASWDEWSETKELERKEEFENWLTKESGNARDFAWGKVNAYYDSKGGSSGITIAYELPTSKL